MSKDENKQAEVIDFTVIRLVRMLSTETDPVRFQILEALFIAYQEGKIGIHWESGEPLFYNLDEGDKASIGMSELLEDVEDDI